MQNNFKATKAEIRKSVLQKRDALSFEERKEKSHVICKKLEEYILSEAFEKGYEIRTIALYDSINSEVDLAELALSPLMSDTFRLVKPIMSDTPGHMEFVEWNTDFDPMKKYDITNFLTIPPDEIDVIVCPLVAFDKDNCRLGYGGGYYDRYYLRLRYDVPKIGVAYSCQEVKAVPCESHDLKLDRIITDN